MDKGIIFLFLEIHGQLIAGSGLPRFLFKLSITGARNIALNVPNITSACYLIQACCNDVVI